LKKAVDEVMWIDQSNEGPWWITFDKPATSPPSFQPGSPFSGDPFQVPRNGNEKSGATTGDVALGTYKYNVRRIGPTGPITDDPDIDIE
jgi:hypothetical protein